jgi:hypothetical protein
LWEERGGREDSGGEGREEHSNSHAGSQNRGPTGADEAAHGPTASQSRNQHAFMTIQSQLLPNNFVPFHNPNGHNINHPSQLSLNDTANHFDLTSQQHHTILIVNSLPNSIPVNQLSNINAADTIINPLYSTLIGNHKTPSFTTHSKTNSNANKSLPNQPLVFTSQQTTKDPPRLLFTKKKKHADY